MANDRSKSIIDEFKPAGLWVAGVVLGLILMFNDHFFLGLIVALGSAFMVKTALAKGVVANVEKFGKEGATNLISSISDIANLRPKAGVDAVRVPFSEALTSASQSWDSGDRERAAEMLEKALSNSPDEADGWFILGKWSDSLSASELLGNGSWPNVERAAHALEQATRIDPNNAAAYYLLSDVYRPLDFRKALLACRSAAKLDPKYESACKDLEDVVAENTHKLSEMNLIHLPTMRVEPTEKLLNEEWYYNDLVKSVAIKGCVRGTSSNMSLFGLLYYEENPDIENDAPRATLQIELTSDGRISVSTSRLV